jgi:D-glycero-alpha-D-manno-heptose-7-phosphate kinase
MIVSRTPYRISFFGGGTDYPAWYRRHGGAVLATTINKYLYLTCRYLPPFFEHRIRLVYAMIELCKTVDEIRHPAIREVLRYLDVRHGVEIHYDGDLPSRSGVGSSSVFVVGLLNAVYALKGQMASKRQLALESCFIEQERLNETVGSQDQVLAAYGGFNHVTFSQQGSIHVRPVTVEAETLNRLNANLMLFFTKIHRNATDIAQTYVSDIEAHERQLHRIGDMVDEALSILTTHDDLTPFGELMHEAWTQKRQLSGLVTRPEVDEIYDAAREAGAVGGKLLGAGGGGFMLLFVPPDKQPAVRERLKDLVYVPFRFEATGSQIIFFDPQSAEEYAPYGFEVEANRLEWDPSQG